MKRTVHAVVEPLEKSRVRALPPEFRPSTVTLSAPLNSSSGLKALVIVHAPPEGWIETDVQVFAAKDAEATSAKLALMVMLIVAPACDPLMPVNAALNDE